MSASTKRAYPLSKVYGLVEPGPVLLLATAQDGRANVMPMSWHTMLAFDPPWVGCVVSDRNHSHAALRETRECTLNVPTEDLATQVVGCGNCSGRDVDKFERFGLTARPGRVVSVPTIVECFASLECRVVDDALAPRLDLFVLEVLRATVDRGAQPAATLHHRGWGRFGVMGHERVLPSRMR